MKVLITLLFVLVAVPVSAGDGFTLDLAEMDFSPSAEEAAPAVAVEGLVDQEIVEQRAEVLAYQAALKPVDPAERNEALWSSDMGRLHYELAAQQAMLGREGLVNGGRMAGVGLGTAAIGDGDPNGALGMALGRGNWAEMNANQKLRAGVEASILGALVAFMVSYAD